MLWMLGFLNTFWYATHMEKKDPVLDLEWVRRFVLKLMGRELTADPQALSLSLLGFREQLMALVADLEKGRFDEKAAIDFLNDHLSQSKGHMSIQMEGEAQPLLRFNPAQVDERAVLSKLAMECFSVLFEMERSRIRICENPTCLCYFYDESKNKSKRHCASNCNNAMKARRHRERKKSAEPSS